jgi:PhzF family phenazine biosynthesis protein
VSAPLAVVDAFTDEAFRGNPAAIVLLETAADGEWMQAVASEMKHAETAFLVPRSDAAFDLRWFTPETEVDLCGHATLASAHALWEWGTLAGAMPARFHTKSGVLTCTRAGALIEMDFPATPASPAEEPAGLFAALGASGKVSRSDFYVLVEVADATTVRSLVPNFTQLAAVDARAVIVTAAGDAGFDVVSRMFAPNVGIPEDPVTGSAHCVLAPYWAPRFGTTLRAYQASPRGGVVNTRIEGDRVILAGNAITVLRGELLR